MAKKVLIGTPRVGGVGTPGHENYTPLEGITDPDGSPIYTAANPPPLDGSGEFLGQFLGSIAWGIGSVVFISTTYPVGTKDIEVMSTIVLAGTNPASISLVGRAWIDLVSGGNQFISLYPVATGYQSVVQGIVTPPSVVYNTSGLIIEVSTFNPATRNIQFRAINPFASSYNFYVKMIFRG